MRSGLRRLLLAITLACAAACGRTSPYDLLAGAGVGGAGGAGGSGTGGAGAGGGSGGSGGGLPSGCSPSDVTVDGQGPRPPPAAIPRLMISGTAGLKGSVPWFDWATGVASGTASTAGELTLSFEGVVVHVRAAPGETAADVAERLVRCAMVPGYRFEILPMGDGSVFISVRRADSRVFARFLVTNDGTGPLFVFADTQELPYWLSIALSPADAPLLLSARGKPVCGGGPPAPAPMVHRVPRNADVPFYWDGTFFTDGGSCLKREVLDGGALFIAACAARSSPPPGSDPFTRPDGGPGVTCAFQQDELSPGSDLAVDLRW